VQDPGAVRAVEGAGDLDRVAQRLAERQRPARQPRRQRLAVQVLHDDEADVPFAADVMEHADVGMVQAREQPRFALEAGARVAVRPDVRRQDLDRDRAIEAGVACAVDFAHAARAEGRLDDVGTEAGSGGEGHRERNYSGFDDARSKAGT
jgi:hypothetical protein